MRWLFVTAAIIGSMGYMWYSYNRAITGALGLELREILIPGQNRTSNASIFWALNMTKRHHMWMQPLRAIQDRLESLPWVQSAAVQRRLPWTLTLTLVEKTPMAIWQNAGKKCVIDGDGRPIEGALPKYFPHLILVAGKDAPGHFRKLLNQLPKIQSLPAVKAASFLRCQRWDLYLDGGTQVQMPQENLGKALMKLVNFWPSIEGSTVIDLRFPDALIFKPCA
jgi:cell division protein FtsQ